LLVFSKQREILEELIEKVLGGEDVVITKAGKPVAKIVPYND
jgi:prevent-host-death family protein